MANKPVLPTSSEMPTIGKIGMSTSSMIKMPARKMKLTDPKKPQQIIAAHNIIGLGGDKTGMSIDTSKKIKITPEDRHKTTFATKWGSYQSTMIPFALKNSPAIFSRVVIVAFREYIHKFLEVYFDDLIVFGANI